MTGSVSAGLVRVATVVNPTELATAVGRVTSNVPFRDPVGATEWVDSVVSEVAFDPATARQILALAAQTAQRCDIFSVVDGMPITTRLTNTIAPAAEVPFPGGDEGMRLTAQIIDALRWNAAMTVAGANKEFDGIGGHIGTFASNADIMGTLLLHFFRGKNHPKGGDHFWNQGHDSPGLYSLAHLQGLLTDEEMARFRREAGYTTPDGKIVIDIAPGVRKGLPSYNHPNGRPELWEHHSVVMGLAGLGSIYQSHCDAWIKAVGLKEAMESRSWVMIGDASSREPEFQADLDIAKTHKLNVKHMVNCNLQGLDGPVDGSGNGQIMQKLEARYRGAGWKVVKVVFGSAWDDLLARDTQGLITDRLMEITDGQWHTYAQRDTAYFRNHFFGKKGSHGAETENPELLALVAELSDDELHQLGWGGHDLTKVYNALKVADETEGPVAVLFRTVKGYKVGNNRDGVMAIHGVKKLTHPDLGPMRDKLHIPLPDEALGDAEHPKYPLWKPASDSPEMVYLKKRRTALAGPVPQRLVVEPPAFDMSVVDSILRGFDTKEFKDGVMSTTVFLNMMWMALMSRPEIGARMPLIAADEMKTFGGEFNAARLGHFHPQGQRYEPADQGKLDKYVEKVMGLILQAGISEAAAIAMFTALATAYATHGLTVLPTFICYSKFLIPHVFSSVWGAADVQARGILAGATAGKTTLNGEGLQHEDGESPLIAHTIPRVRTYDPSLPYEMATILRAAITRTFGEGDRFNEIFYLLMYNETWPVYTRAPGVADADILGGLYLFREADASLHQAKPAQILASGPMFHEAVRAQDLLAAKGIGANLWSATSFSELARDLTRTQRAGWRHMDHEAPVSTVDRLLTNRPGPIIAATDYDSSYPGLISRAAALQGADRFLPLGTEGFGRSDTRAVLRRLFQVDAASIALATMGQMVRRGELAVAEAVAAREEWGIDPDAPHGSAV